MSREFRHFEACVNDKKQEILSSFRGVILGCSGGPDSTALFHLFQALSKREKIFPLAVAHVAYGLRADESEADFTFVQNLAQKAGVPFICQRVEGFKPSTGIQAWARDVRRRFFDQLATEGWVIALAHHLDDVAETALFRLARGTSAANAAGMRVWDPPYWRPLLHERKAELLAFLERENLPFRLDSSNEGDAYARNIIRNRVLPQLEALFPGAAARIAQTALEAQSPTALTTAAQNLTTQLPRSAQLSRRLLQTLPGGHLLVAPPSDVPKARRESQHRMSHKGFEASVLLEPGSHATLTRGSRRWRFTAEGSDQPLIMRAFSIGAKTPLQFSQVASASPGPASQTHTLKGLSRRWSIPKDAREDYLAIEYNQVLVGLHDGASIVCPAPADGSKRVLDQRIFEIL